MRPTVEEFERELESFADYNQSAATGNDRYTQRWYERKADASNAALLAMFRRALEATDDE